MEVEALQENFIIPESLYDGKYSKTAQFMLPAIGINVLKPIIAKYFENAFLTDKEHKHNYTRPIFLLFSVKDYLELDWKRVYSRLLESKNFITEYDVGVQNNKYLIMLVFSVPSEYANDYLNFRLGRYSKFSEDYKKNFPEFREGKRNIYWQIVNKDEELRQKITKTFGVAEDLLNSNDEIWDEPRHKREFYRYKEKDE
jgi:hypothetical protein